MNTCHTSDPTLSHPHLSRNAAGGGDESKESATYDNIFDLYGSRDLSVVGAKTASFVEFCRTYRAFNGQLQRLAKPAVLLFSPEYSSNPTGARYHLYCKYFLLKHRPWVGKADNAWGGQGLPDSDPAVIQHYVQQFMTFTADATASSFEMFSGDADRLRRIRVQCNK